MNDSIDNLGRGIEYAFSSRELAETAVTHRSAGQPHNERLEFLGDALLGAVIAEALYFRFPSADEGQLTRMRAALVNKHVLAEIARERSLGDFVRLGEGERKSGGWQRDSTLANVVEAIIGAVYLDGGFGACQTFVCRLLEKRLESLSLDRVEKDPKTQLQEILQSRHHALPGYQVVSISGEPHARIFTVNCTVAGLVDEPVTATGTSVRRAEQEAARKILAKLLSQCVTN